MPQPGSLECLSQFSFFIATETFASTKKKKCKWTQYLEPYYKIDHSQISKKCSQWKAGGNHYKSYWWKWWHWWEYSLARLIWSKHVYSNFFMKKIAIQMYDIWWHVCEIDNRKRLNWTIWKCIVKRDDQNLSPRPLLEARQAGGLWDVCSQNAAKKHFSVQFLFFIPSPPLIKFHHQPPTNSTLPTRQNIVLTSATLNFTCL